MTEQFWTTFSTAVLVALPPTLLAMKGLVSIRNVHKQLNSRLEEMLKIASARADAEGEIRGRAIKNSTDRVYISEHLRIHAEVLRAVATETQDVSDIKAAEIAERMLGAHLVKALIPPS